MRKEPGWRVLRQQRQPDPHLRDWLLWCDWCAATERPPLPAEPDHIAEFVASLNGERSIRRRRIASILAKCDEFGEPVLLESAEPAVWREALGDPAEVLASIPRWGWPSGLNRRRDAFVVVLAAMGLTRRQICALRQEQVALTPTGWFIDGRAVPVADDPAGCASCAAHDWLMVLGMVAGGGRGESQAYLTRAPRGDGHRCTEPLNRRWRHAAQLIPAIDRHGWPQDAHPVSTRTVTQILRAWIAAAATGEPADEPDVAQPRLPMSNLTAEQVDDLLDELDARVESISGRVDELMRTVYQG